MLMVCSTIPIRTVAGGALQLELAIYRWPHILFFSKLSLEERMYLIACGEEMRLRAVRTLMTAEMVIQK